MTRPDKSPTPQTYVPPFDWPPADPRAADAGVPIAQPRAGVLYPEEGRPYPDPDRDPLDDPTVITLTPNTAVVGAPNFTIHVIGTNFFPGTVILWNGAEEPTTIVSETEVTTGVNMATVSGPATVPVSVRAITGAESNALPFTFTAT